MTDITPEPPAEEPTVDPTAEHATAPAAEPATSTMAATPAPFATDTPRTRRFSTPVAGGVIAGVVGLGLGAGVVALAGGHDDHHGNDRRMSDQQVQAQNQAQDLPGMQGQQGGQGGFMPGRRGDRQGQQGQQGQQGGGFFPPNGGGQPQGRSGGS